ncbi:MAG: D-alanyl-D-alanine carboxypeptidase/D-alanyl-D-alanine-endopeptidase [Burkholderiaceae bacterium]
MRSITESPASRPVTRVFGATVVLILLAAFTGCATVGREPPAPVEDALRQAGVSRQSLAVVAFPIDAPATGLRLNADQPMQPASTMKLITAAVALDRLGPNSRGRTELLIDGTVRDGRLGAPLYLKGGADADLDWSALWLMLRDLRERSGVQSLEGGIVVDRSLFNPSRPELGLPPFDEQPEFPYNVIPDALNLNGTLLSYEIRSEDSTLRATAFPAFGGAEIDASAMTLNDKACRDWEDGWQQPDLQVAASGMPRLVLRGEFPRQCVISQRLNVMDRQWLTAQALRQLWTSLGGTITGDIREGATPPGARTVALHQDRPLAELLRPVMKSSDNATTRLIFNRLGASAAQPGEETRASAARVVRDWFSAQGVDSTGLVLDNGSGLSRAERVTAQQMAGLLLAAHRGRQGPELLATLPVAGVDGTLSRRMKGTAAEGRARLKTGTLRNVVALAGYVPDARGRLWIVATMINDEQAAKARPAIDALIDWVARQ